MPHNRSLRNDSPPLLRGELVGGCSLFLLDMNQPPPCLPLDKGEEWPLQCAFQD